MGKYSLYNKNIRRNQSPEKAFKGIDDKYYYTYITYNLCNGKYYKGSHMTTDLYDGYVGSSKYLCLAVEKYGYINFFTEVTGFYHNRKEMVDAEDLLIKDNEWIEKNYCYNKSPGRFNRKSEALKVMPKRKGELTEELKDKIKLHKLQLELSDEGGWRSELSLRKQRLSRRENNNNSDYWKPIILKDKESKEVREFENIYEAVDILRNLDLSVQAKKIARALNESNRSHPRGFYWKFKERSTTSA